MWRTGFNFEPLSLSSILFQLQLPSLGWLSYKVKKQQYVKPHKQRYEWRTWGNEWVKDVLFWMLAKWLDSGVNNNN